MKCLVGAGSPVEITLGYKKFFSRVRREVSFFLMKDRESNGKNGGGVCIYIRSNINFQLRADLSPNNLEFLTVEITRPRSKPFLVSTWYRPPQSSPDLFSTFERIFDNIDAENLELYLMGVLNCNLLSEVVNNNSSHLLNIIDIYGLTQLITESTRVTQYSSTLIDLWLTNSPDKISKSGESIRNGFAVLFA